MILSELKSLRDFIIENNSYFNKGFYNAFQDNQTGKIYSGDKVIFPDDTLGNYFYLRLPKNYSFSENTYFATDECHRAIGLNAQVVLVACMCNADTDILLFNLVNTIGSFNEVIKIVSATGDSTNVIATELAKISKENIDAALQRLDKDYTIVSVNFTYTKGFDFVDLNCLTNPTIC